MERFIEKLNTLMNLHNLNKNSLAKQSGISYSTITNWYKRGCENVTMPSLYKLSEFFNTTTDFWIVDEINDLNCSRLSELKLTSEEIEFLKKYRSLSSFDKETIDIILNREYRKASLSTDQDNHEQIAAFKIGKSVLEDAKHYEKSSKEQVG